MSVPSPESFTLRSRTLQVLDGSRRRLHLQRYPSEKLSSFAVSILLDRYRGIGVAGTSFKFIAYCICAHSHFHSPQNVPPYKCKLPMKPARSSHNSLFVSSRRCRRSSALLGPLPRLVCTMETSRKSRSGLSATSCTFVGFGSILTQSPTRQHRDIADHTFVCGRNPGDGE